MDNNLKIFYIMKTLKQLTLLVAMVCAGSSLAQPQFTNSSFEQWDNTTNMPVGWSGLTFTSTLANVDLCDISQTNDAQQGSFAVEIKMKEINSSLSAVIAQLLGGDPEDELEMPAIFTNGQIIFNTQSIREFIRIVTIMDSIQEANHTEYMNQYVNLMSQLITAVLDGGLELNSYMPSSISGFYNFVPSSSGIYEEDNDDEKYVAMLALLYNEDTSKHLVGIGATELYATTGYDSFNVPIIPFGEDVQAEKLIYLVMHESSSYDDDGNVSFGSLKLDNLKINYNSSSIEDIAKQELQAYPNPTDNNTFILTVSQPTDVRIYDVLGHQVAYLPNYFKEQIRLSNSGMYFVHCGDKVVKLVVK